MVKFRTDDPNKWGAGKGSNLTADEVDTNFWELLSRLVAVEDNPAEPTEIASFSVSGSQLTVHMADGTEHGPLTLPTALIRFRGDWTPDTAYFELDLVFVPDQGLYMALLDHTSGAEFDPVAVDAEGNLLYRHLMPAGASGGGGKLEDLENVQLDMSPEFPLPYKSFLYNFGGDGAPWAAKTISFEDFGDVNFYGSGHDGAILYWRLASEGSPEGSWEPTYIQPNDGDVLAWNTGSRRWQPTGLPNFNIWDEPVDGALLTYDASGGYWWAMEIDASNLYSLAQSPDPQDGEVYGRKDGEWTAVREFPEPIGNPQDAHKYWRLAVLLTREGYDTSFTTEIVEMEFAAGAGEPDQALNGQAIYGSRWSSSYPASNAFDDNTDDSSTWRSHYNPNPPWIGYEFPEPVNVAEVRIYVSADATKQEGTPTIGIVQYSDDGEKWADAFDVDFDNSATGWTAASASWPPGYRVKDPTYAFRNGEWVDLETEYFPVLPTYGEHKHWRINVHSNFGSNVSVRVAELGLYSEPGGANHALGATMTGTGDSSTSGGPKSDAVDGDPATFWRSDGAPPDVVLQAELSEPRDIRHVTISITDDNLDGGPKGFDVEWSDDGASWTTAWSVERTDPYAALETYGFPAPMDYRGAVEDVPADGVLYGRQDGSWVPVPEGGGGSGSGIADAPADGTPYVRQDSDWTPLPSTTADWADLTGKPSEFPPEAHTHSWAEITEVPASFPPEAHGHDWSEITGRPDVIDALPTAPGAAGTVLKAQSDGSIAWATDATGDGGGATTFLGLDDTPAGFGTPGEVVAVNSAGTALEFIAAPTGGGGGGIEEAPADGQSYVRRDADWSPLPAISWSDVAEKPTEFQPAAHTHDWTGIDGKPTAFPPLDHGHAWADISDIPATVGALPATIGSDGQVLKAQSDGTIAWGADATGGTGGGATALDDLSDVDTATTTPEDGQALVWDAVSSVWIPADVLTSGSFNILEFAGNAGRVLAVNATEDAAEWVDLQTPVAISTFAGGTIADAEVIIFHLAVAETVFAEDMAGSFAQCLVAPTAEAVFDIQHNGASVGSVTFAASGTTGAFSVTGGLTMAAGDDLRVVGPATADIEGVSLSLKGVM